MSWRIKLVRVGCSKAVFGVFIKIRYKSSQVVGNILLHSDSYLIYYQTKAINEKQLF